MSGPTSGSTSSLVPTSCSQVSAPGPSVHSLLGYSEATKSGLLNSWWLHRRALLIPLSALSPLLTLLPSQQDTEKASSSPSPKEEPPPTRSDEQSQGQGTYECLHPCLQSPPLPASVSTSGGWGQEAWGGGDRQMWNLGTQPRLCSGQCSLSQAELRSTQEQGSSEIIWGSRAPTGSPLANHCRDERGSVTRRLSGYIPQL